MYEIDIEWLNDCHLWFTQFSLILCFLFVWFLIIIVGFFLLSSFCLLNLLCFVSVNLHHHHHHFYSLDYYLLLFTIIYILWCLNVFHLFFFYCSVCLPSLKWTPIPTNMRDCNREMRRMIQNEKHKHNRNGVKRMMIYYDRVDRYISQRQWQRDFIRWRSTITRETVNLICIT